MIDTLFDTLVDELLHKFVIEVANLLT